MTFKSVINSVKRAVWFVVHHSFALAVTAFLILAAVVCFFGGRTLQIGGLLQKLWGKGDPEKEPNGTPPIPRVDETGVQIQPGVSDDKGFVQAPVSTQILDPGVFSNPDVVTVVHPDKGNVSIPLPVGVKNTDVREVVEISADVYEVRNKDKGVSPSVIGGLLGRIGKPKGG